jgi:hypothetical protein
MGSDYSNHAFVQKPGADRVDKITLFARFGIREIFKHERSARGIDHENDLMRDEKFSMLRFIIIYWKIPTLNWVYWKWARRESTELHPAPSNGNQKAKAPLFRMFLSDRFCLLLMEIIERWTIKICNYIFSPVSQRRFMQIIGSLRSSEWANGKANKFWKSSEIQFPITSIRYSAQASQISESHKSRFSNFNSRCTLKASHFHIFQASTWINIRESSRRTR